MNPEQNNQSNPNIPPAPSTGLQPLNAQQQYPPTSQAQRVAQAPQGALPPSQPQVVQPQQGVAPQPAPPQKTRQLQQASAPMQPRLSALKHHIIWIIVGVVLFMLIGIGAFIASGVSSVTFDEYDTYTDTTIQMLYPADWEVDTVASTSWTFSSGATAKESIAAIEVSQIALALPQYQTASEAEKDVLVATLLSTYRADIDAQPPAGFTTIDESSFNVGKHPAADRSVTFSLVGVNTLGTSVKGAGDVIITETGNVFVIFAAAEQNVWDLNTTNFEEMLNSFKVR